MIHNDEGKVAMRHIRQNQKYIRMGDGTEYVFIMQANISMSWVFERHVNPILRMQRSCCGGRTKPAFMLASETDVRRWTNKGGR